MLIQFLSVMLWAQAEVSYESAFSYEGAAGPCMKLNRIKSTHQNYGNSKLCR
jgi:hypothetical protein